MRQVYLLRLLAGFSYRTMSSTSKSSRGALVVLEGLDRTGKSTQARRVVEALKKQGIETEAWRFPDRSTTLGKVIGEYLSNAQEVEEHTIHLLFSGNRWEKSAEMLEKLKHGVTLVVDRYAFSGAAFSSAKPGLSLEWCRSPDVGLPKPDLVCFLHADLDVLKSRDGYGTERYETENFQKVVARRYAELEDDTWVRVDASGHPEEITNNILQAIAEKTEDLPEEIGKLWAD